MDKKDLDLEQLGELIDMDSLKISKLKKNGHLQSMLEDFEILRIKFMYDKIDNKEDALRFITLLKYFAENGPSEAFRLSCTYMLEKYVKKQE